MNPSKLSPAQWSLLEWLLDRAGNDVGVEELGRRDPLGTTTAALVRRGLLHVDPPGRDATGQPVPRRAYVTHAGGAALRDHQGRRRDPSSWRAERRAASRKKGR